MFVIQNHFINMYFKRMAAFLSAIQFLFVLLAVPIPVSASILQKTSMTDIRIGLKSSYSNTASIRIQNTKIGLGYCIDGQYSSETEFISSTGFLFQPYEAGFYAIDKTYPSYSRAEAAADVMRSLKVDAYPVSVGRNAWMVYIGGDTSGLSLSEIYERIKGRFSYQYVQKGTDNQHRIMVTGKDIVFLIDGGVHLGYPQFKALDAGSSQVMNLGSRKYRGRIEIGRYGSSMMTAVNIINIESYLLGVVPSEMPGSWPMEALKAQAVSSRSFALSKTSYQADSSIYNAYYIDDTTNSQVYHGYQAENERTAQAVAETMGQVITYEGTIIPAYFYSTSGGSTEDSLYVWGTSKPYFVKKPDPYETEPGREPWIYTFTKDQIADRISMGSNSIGTINRVYTQLVTSSGRVYFLKASGTDSTITYTAGSIREGFGLPSTKFKLIEYGDIPDLVSVRSASEVQQERISSMYILSAAGKGKAEKDIAQFIVKGAENTINYPVKAPEDADTYFFAGMGYGHGVGLSQSGAKGFANAGYSYIPILLYYYEGCEVINMNTGRHYSEEE